jgi:ATP-dependent DNA helicase RecQ
MPKSLEGYYQETGRGGRDGGEGQCIAFYAYKDLDKLRKFMQGKPVAEQEIGNQLLLETQAYAESSICRRKLLLHYFGEDYENDNFSVFDFNLNCLIAYKAKNKCSIRISIDAITSVVGCCSTGCGTFNLYVHKRQGHARPLFRNSSSNLKWLS